MFYIYISNTIQESYDTIGHSNRVWNFHHQRNCDIKDEVQHMKIKLKGREVS